MLSFLLAASVSLPSSSSRAVVDEVDIVEVNYILNELGYPIDCRVIFWDRIPGMPNKVVSTRWAKLPEASPEEKAEAAKVADQVISDWTQAGVYDEYDALMIHYAAEGRRGRFSSIYPLPAKDGGYVCEWLDQYGKEEVFRRVRCKRRVFTTRERYDRCPSTINESIYPRKHRRLLTREATSEDELDIYGPSVLEDHCAP